MGIFLGRNERHPVLLFTACLIARACSCLYTKLHTNLSCRFSFLSFYLSHSSVKSVYLIHSMFSSAGLTMSSFQKKALLASVLTTTLAADPPYLTAAKTKHEPMTTFITGESLSEPLLLERQQSTAPATCGYRNGKAGEFVSRDCANGSNECRSASHLWGLFFLWFFQHIWCDGMLC